MKGTISSKKLTVRYGLYQVAYYATCVGTSAFAATYLLEKGFSASAVGIILALTNIFSCILQPILGDIIDRLKTFILPQVIAFFLAGALGCYAIIQLCQPSLGWFGFLYGVGLLLISSTVSLNNSLCVYYSENNYPINYGMGIGVGSFSFSVFSLGMGYVMAWLGFDIMIWFALITLTAQMMIVIGYPKLSDKVLKKAEKKGNEVNQRVSLFAFFGKYKYFTITLIGVIFLAICHCMMENYLITIFESMGGGSENVGIALSVASFTATPILLYFERFQKKVSVLTLIRLAGVFFICKATLLIFATDIWHVYMIQFFQMFTFGFSYPALFYFVKLRITEADMAKGQAVAAVVFPLGTAIGSFVGGRAIDYFGLDVMLIMALVFACVGTFIVNLMIHKGGTK